MNIFQGEGGCCFLLNCCKYVTRTGTSCLTQDNFMGGLNHFIFFKAHFFICERFSGGGGVVSY